MEREVLKKLLLITHEELKILKKNNKNIEYASATVEGNTIYDKNGVTIRKNTRYIDFEEHTHNFIEISFGVMGKVLHIVNDKPISVGAYDLFIIGKKSNHAIKTAKERDIAINFLVRETFLKEILHFIEDDLKFKQFVEDLFYTDKYSYDLQKNLKTVLEKDMEVLLKNIFFLDSNDVAVDIYINYIILKMLHIVYQNYSEVTYEKILSKNLITTYIDQNYSTASLSEFANYLKVNYHFLSREIKSICGANFKDLLQNKRLEVACDLLKYTELTVREISSQVGYENYSYFYKIFYDKYKITPVEYRNSN